MYIHIGERKIVSDKICIGIFNFETLSKSTVNNWITSNLNNKVKTIVIDNNNNIVYSKVSSFTIIKRKSIDKDFYWRRINV